MIPLPLYNHSSVPFPILLPPLVPIQNISLSSLFHPFLSAWVTLLPDPPPLRPVKRPSPLNENTERCSKMVPVKSGLRASKKFSSMVQSLLLIPLTHLTCPLFQACGNTGNLHGPPIPGAAADGGTNFSWTI